MVSYSRVKAINIMRFEEYKLDEKFEENGLWLFIGYLLLFSIFISPPGQILMDDRFFMCVAGNFIAGLESYQSTFYSFP